MTLTTRTRDYKNKQAKLCSIHSVHESLDVLVSSHMLHFILHVVVLVALCDEFSCCQCTKLIHFLTCTGIPCRDSHSENGLVRCCLYNSRRLQQTAVSCKRSNCNKIKKCWKSNVWSFIQRWQTMGPPVLSCRFASNLNCGRSFNYHELHQELLNCHQMEEELDDWCHFWYFQNGTGLSCCSPDSWCRRFGTIFQWSCFSRKIERHPQILSVSKVLCLRHMNGEIFLRKFVHLDTDFFCSIMCELRFTKFRIFQESIVNPFTTPLDASLSPTMGNMIVSLFFSFPMSMAMRSSLLKDIILTWEKVQCTLNGASVGFTFFQEMPASAIDDALTQVQKALFALRFRSCLEQFKQLHIAPVLNHLLGLFTKWVAGIV